ncbi:uncharacterized protein UTRI_00878_B [Ustilago trichophora]|uniref:PH domain-containing protein n=1 Tax=Ustilago trichophora TaxID=86804 RepID=A0A5C3DTJ3_9BASI|nr:uncharacterized protein UTRI_00878_B [Ustilago trichophora]
MLPSPFESRLPRYEGHLILNQAILSDSPQTSACTAWSERWCSLEDGKLLVYNDRTAAMISPHDTCAVIDVRSFACVQSSNTANESSHELVLSTSLPEPTRSSRLFRPKSAMSLNRLQIESAPRDTTESDPRPSMASLGRISFQSQSAANTSFTSSAKTDADGRPASRNKPWSKFASGSRRLYSKLSSTTSLRTNESLPFQSASTTSSIPSFSESRESTDIASSRAPSPRTPHSSTFSGMAERVPVRAPTAEAFNSWLEALTLTIKVHNEMAPASSPIMRQQKRVSSRPSLANLPGFRTPTSLQASPVFPSIEPGAASLVEEVTPKASRKRQVSSSSFSSALHASQHLQQKVGGRSSRPSTAASTSIKIAEHITINKPPKRPSTADASSTFASQTFAAVDNKRLQRERKHKRSISAASSSLSFSVTGLTLSSPRRNSVSTAQMFSCDGVEPLSSSRQPQLKVSGLASQLNDKPAEVGDITELTSSGTLPSMTRHRRSGSVLRFGSARIMAWRDTFTASDSTKTVTPIGLGLEAEAEIGDASQADWNEPRPQSKPAKSFPRLKSFRLLPKTKADDHQGDITLHSRQDDSVSFASPSEPRCSEDVLASHMATMSRSAALPRTKGMSRTASLLNLTKSTFSSFRDKSASRQSVKHAFTVQQEEDEMNVDDLSHDSPSRVQSPGCDFSYELVGTQREAICSVSPVIPSGLPAFEQPHFAAAVDDEDPSQPLQGLHSSTGDISAQLMVKTSSTDTSTPSLPIERILPPETIISTFDQLRAADPTGLSCDWLSQIESSHHPTRGSLDWAARKKTLRPAASQQFDLRGGSMDLSSTTKARRLRGSISAFQLQPEGGNKRLVDREEESCSRISRPASIRSTTASRRMSEDVPQDTDLGSRLRSLPAPPRASKRRARISTSSHSRPTSPLAPPLLPSVDITHPNSRSVLSNLTNSTTDNVRSSEGDLPNLDKLMLDERPSRNKGQLQMTPPPPLVGSRRLGRRRLSSATTNSVGRGSPGRGVMSLA